MDEERRYRKIINSWCMYDWANSAFACTMMGAVFGPFYRSVAQNAGLAPHQATAYYGWTTSLALLLIALLAPVLGAISDYTGGKKRYTAFFAGLGVLSTAACIFIGRDTWLLASLLFIGGNIGFAGSEAFYESLLPHIAKKNDIDQISTRGYALGYIGGGLLLVLNVLWIMKPHFFGMPDTDFALRATFLSVAVWWGVFTAPFLRNVPEPPSASGRVPARNPVSQGFKRLRHTFQEVRQYKQLLIFLAAFWVYNDGIGTIIKMATAYGDEIGIGLTDLITALIITQFVGIPFSFLFGRLAKTIGTKTSILIALAVYTGICVSAYFMKTAWHFYILAFMVGTVQGGSQALSRSLYGAMVPRHKSAEFFGFFGTSSKFAGIMGPAIFALFSQVTGQSRLSIVALVVFFILGGLLLLKVDVEKGVRAAREAEAPARVLAAEAAAPA
ncbi:MAG: MFS transporter [Thermodesulfobacteriota bacterium]